ARSRRPADGAVRRRARRRAQANASFSCPAETLGFGGGRARGGWPSRARATSSGLMAISTTRMRPSQPSRGQTETSTAKTRRRSQAHGWREGGGGSSGASLASNKGSCGGGLGGSRPGTTSARTAAWAASKRRTCRPVRNERRWRRGRGRAGDSRRRIVDVDVQLAVVRSAGARSDAPLAGRKRFSALARLLEAEKAFLRDRTVRGSREGVCGRSDGSWE